MIDRRCEYCKYAIRKLTEQPCRYCGYDPCTKTMSRFEFDPRRYFKHEMEKLAKEFDVRVNFEYGLYFNNHNSIKATLETNSPMRTTYTIAIADYNSEDDVNAAIENCRKSLTMYNRTEDRILERLSKQRKYVEYKSLPKIKDVKFNGPATIVFWEDGTKTVVKCGEGDRFNSEKGLAMAIAKKALGNEVGYYSENIEPWVEKYRKEKRNNLVKELDEFGNWFARDFYNKLKLRGVDD